MSEWLIALLAVLCNFVLWFTMFGVQAWESRTGRIPPRSKEFRYLQDFWTNGPFGDLLALSFIDAAVGIGLARYGVDQWAVLAPLAGGLAVFLFISGTMQEIRKAPDSGFLKRGNQWVPTTTGSFHAMYFFLQATTAALALILLFTGKTWGYPLALGLAGGFLYCIATAVDYRRGVLTP